MFGKGLSVGKLFGITIGVDPTWLIIFVLITWNLAFGLFPQIQPGWSQPLVWAVSIAASLLFFGSVLAHEFAHSLVAKARGLPVNRITLFLFGGVSNLEKEPESPFTEFVMAIVGPATSIVLGAVFLAIFSLIGNDILMSANPVAAFRTLDPISTLLLWLGQVSILVGLFNLIPGFPLDGGRVLRSVIWALTGKLRQATKIASLIGDVVAYSFMLIGLIMVFGVNVPVFGTGLIGGIWIFFIGWLLNNLSSRSYEQVVLKDLLSGVLVSKIMTNDFIAVPSNITLSELVDRFMLKTEKKTFPVVNNGKFLGIVTVEDIFKTPRENWQEEIVSQVMTEAKDVSTVTPKTEASNAVDEIARKDIGLIPVVEDGLLKGVVSRKDIFLWLKLNKEEEEISVQ